MNERITVCCTGKGTHGRIDWDRFDVIRDDIEHVTTRRGRSPLRGEGTAQEDGRQIPISIGARMIVPATPSRADHGTWRWKCPKCGRDRPLTDANLRAALILLARNGEPVLDISRLPR